MPIELNTYEVMLLAAIENTNETDGLEKPPLEMIMTLARHRAVFLAEDCPDGMFDEDPALDRLCAYDLIGVLHEHHGRGDDDWENTVWLRPAGRQYLEEHRSAHGPMGRAAEKRANEILVAAQEAAGAAQQQAEAAKISAQLAQDAANKFPWGVVIAFGALAVAVLAYLFPRS